MTKRRLRTVLWKMSGGFAVGARPALLLLITQGKAFYPEIWMSLVPTEEWVSGC